MSQQPDRPVRFKIPLDHAAEFDLVVDVSIMRRERFDDARVWQRLRAPANTVLSSKQRAELGATVLRLVADVLDKAIDLPAKKGGTK